jgi:hypothetical protein
MEKAPVATLLTRKTFVSVFHEKQHYENKDVFADDITFVFNGGKRTELKRWILLGGRDEQE